MNFVYFTGFNWLFSFCTDAFGMPVINENTTKLFHLQWKIMIANMDVIGAITH